MQFEKLKNIVKANVKSYVSDFYEFDLPELNNPKERFYLWIVRTSGTYLIPRSLVVSSEVLHYWMKNAEGTGQIVKYYEIDTNIMKPKRINNIQQYVNECKEEIFEDFQKGNNEQDEIDICD